MNDTIPALGQFMEPAPVRFSPEAPGWYTLGILFFLVLLGIAFLIWNSYRKNRYRKLAIRRLDQEEKKLEEKKDYISMVYVANMLVKQISINLDKREEVASLRGKKWLDYLNKTCSSVSFSESDEAILNAIYGTDKIPDAQHIFSFMNKIKTWIRKHHIQS